MWIWSLGRRDPLEKEIEAHSGILAWEIQWTGEPGRLQSMGHKKVGHNSVTTQIILEMWYFWFLFWVSWKLVNFSTLVGPESQHYVILRTYFHVYHFESLMEFYPAHGAVQTSNRWIMGNNACQILGSSSELLSLLGNATLQVSVASTIPQLLPLLSVQFGLYLPLTLSGNVCRYTVWL